MLYNAMLASDDCAMIVPEIAGRADRQAARRAPPPAAAAPMAREEAGAGCRAEGVSRVYATTVLYSWSAANAAEAMAPA